MAAQFDVYRTVSNSLVVVIQNNLLSDLKTRAVAFIADDRSPSESIRHLTPSVMIEGKICTLEAHTVATLSLAELGSKVGSLHNQRDKIIRAIDALLGGI